MVSRLVMEMELSRTLKYVVAIAMALWELLGWMLAITGLGKMQRSCDSQIDFGFDTCTSLLRQSWWTIAFQTFVLSGICGVLFVRKLDVYKSPIVAFLVMSTMKLMQEAELMLDVVEAEAGVPEGHGETAFVGFVLMCILNFVLIIALGSSTPSDTESISIRSKAASSHTAQSQSRKQQQIPESHSKSSATNAKDRSLSVSSTGATS